MTALVESLRVAVGKKSRKKETKKRGEKAEKLKEGNE